MRDKKRKAAVPRQAPAPRPALTENGRYVIYALTSFMLVEWTGWRGPAEQDQCALLCVRLGRRCPDRPTSAASGAARAVGRGAPGACAIHPLRALAVAARVGHPRVHAERCALQERRALAAQFCDSLGTRVTPVGRAALAASAYAVSLGQSTEVALHALRTGRYRGGS